MKSLALALVGILCVGQLSSAQSSSKKVTRKTYPCSMEFITISPDGSRLVSSGRHAPLPSASIQAWDLNTLTLAWNSPFSRVSPRPMAIEAIAVSPDGKTIAAGDWAGGVILIDAETGQKLRTVDLEGNRTTGVAHIAFSQSGNLVAVSAQTGRTHVFSATDWRLRVTLEGTTLGWSLAFNPDGRQLGIADSGAARLFDTDSGKQIRSYTTSPRPSTKSDSLKGVVYRVAFNRDGKLLATATSDVVQVWDVQSGQESYRTNAGHSTPGSLAFSADGTQIAWANWNDEIHLWAFSKGKKPQKAKVRSLLGLAIFRPDFKLAYVSAHETSLSVVELPTGRVRNTVVCTDFIHDEPQN
jgi:WD40 repeat protein